MRIAQIDTVYHQGSTGKIVETIHEFLLDSGHQSMAFYGRGPNQNEDNVVKVNHDFEVYLDAGLSRISGYTGIFSHFATGRLIDRLKKFSPDVVHLHELHGYYLHQYKLLEYLREERIPIVWTLHCENAYTGRCGFAFDCNQWMTSCIKCPSLVEYPKSLFFDRSKIQFQWKKNQINGIELIKFAPVSKWLNDRLGKSFLKEKESSVIYNGIDVEGVFYPRNWEDLARIHPIKDDFVVLSVAPDLMSSRKGGRWVVELAKRWIDKPIKFIMIGVKERNIDFPPNVIVMSPIVDLNELAYYYSMADVYLITSQSETFSLTTAEALACGTPVIGFDSGGPSEVAPEPYGHFVPFGDLAGLHSLIEKSYSGVLPMATREDCVEYGRHNFSNARMCRDYLNLYDEMIVWKSGT